MNTINPSEKPAIRVEGIQPILSVRDLRVSRTFYVGLLGFEEATRGTDDFTSLHRDGGSAYLCRGAQGHPGTWIWVGFDGDINALYNHLQAKGVKILKPPTNVPWP